jgi:hypothetical protein
MKQLEIAGPALVGRLGLVKAIPDFLRPWLTGRRGLTIGGIAVVIAGLALGWNWLTAIGVAPVILSLAPCAAMCAVGACAMMKGNASSVAPTASEQAKPLEPGSSSALTRSDD